MIAAERMRASIGYLQYNYGLDHPLTRAAERGDIAAFRAAGRHVTEMMDARVVEIIDAPDGGEA